MFLVTSQKQSKSVMNKKSKPFTTPCAARNIAMVKALEKMTFWPEFKYERDVVIFTDDFSY